MPGLDQFVQRNAAADTATPHGTWEGVRPCLDTPAKSDPSPTLTCIRRGGSGFLLAVILGATAMALCVAAVEMIGHRIYPLPAGIDFKNPETLKGYIAELPVAALLFVVAGWALGSLVGGYIAARISRRPAPHPCRRSARRRSGRSG